MKKKEQEVCENQDGKNDLFHYLRNAEEIARRKYQLVGFKNKKMIDQLVEFDIEFANFVYLHRKELETAIRELEDELSLIDKW